MSEYKVTCQGRTGSTYNYIFEKADITFVGGAVKTVDESIAKFLVKQKFSSGKSIFRIEKSIQEKIVEEKVEDALQKAIEETEIEKKITPVKTNTIKPPINNKKQDKLV